MEYSRLPQGCATHKTTRTPEDEYVCTACAQVLGYVAEEDTDGRSRSAKVNFTSLYWSRKLGSRIGFKKYNSKVAAMDKALKVMLDEAIKW